MSESGLSLDDRCVSAVAQPTGTTAVPARFRVRLLPTATPVSARKLAVQVRE